jgi:class 3 adenylate cyclase
MVAANQTPSSRTPAPAALTRRSRVSNGKQLFVGRGDGEIVNQKWLRRLSDLISLHIADLGGPANTSESEKMLVRRAAMLTLQLELMEQGWAEHHNGVAPAKRLIEYQQVCSALRRILESLGLKRRARNVTPSVADYVASINAQEVE